LGRNGIAKRMHRFRIQYDLLPKASFGSLRVDEYD
jgi:hypothetical protein